MGIGINFDTDDEDRGPFSHWNEDVPTENIRNFSYNLTKDEIWQQILKLNKKDLREITEKILEL